MIKYKKGFTLIEMTLVITIISLLATFVLVVIDPGKKLGNAKDARRYNDADIIKQAISEYVLDNQSLPTEITTMTTNTPYAIRGVGVDDPGSVNCNNLLGVVSTTAITIVPVYLPTLPTDPDDAYYYWYRKNNDVTVAPCTTYSNALDINNGLVALWHFDEDVWTGSGYEVKDWVGGYHATSTAGSTASTTTDNIYGAKGGFFDNGRVTIDASASLNTANFSQGYWFKNSGVHTSTGSLPRITGKSAYHFETAIAKSYGPADNKSLYFFGSAWTDTGYDADAGEWHYYLWTYDGTNLILYVDGVQQYNQPVAITISASDNFFIGNRYPSITEGVTGNIDEVAIWNRALSQAEATYIYNLEKP